MVATVLVHEKSVLENQDLIFGVMKPTYSVRFVISPHDFDATLHLDFHTDQHLSCLELDSS